LDIRIGVSNGATRATITPMVHDYIIVGVSRGPSNILIRLTSSSYSVLVASIDWPKKVTQVPPIGSMHREKNVVQVLEFGIGGFGSKMDFEDLCILE
jgi:hypothetical protein